MKTKLKKLVKEAVRNIVREEVCAHREKGELGSVLGGAKHNCKQLGRMLAREGFSQLMLEDNPPTDPGSLGFVSKACTFEDLQSVWFSYWVNELHMEPMLHRKLWEFAFICQILHEAGCLEKGKKALGFGCGEEELPSLFASRGVEVIATDLDPHEVKGMGWAETGQHTSGKEALYFPEIIDRDRFDRNVSLEYADMNDISRDYDARFDICWSVCALEHLGSIQHGIDFVLNSGKTLKSGGILVHTTEFNIFESESTIDHQQTVLFRKKDFEEMATVLERSGFDVAPLDFEVGNTVVDQFVDLPPYVFDGRIPRDEILHLKLMLEGFASTCFGLVAKKR